MALDANNAADLTSSNTTDKWHGAVRGTLTQIHLYQKPSKTNPVHIHSSVSTAKITTSPTVSSVLTGNIGLIENGILKRPRSSEKSEPIQSAQL